MRHKIRLSPAEKVRDKLEDAGYRVVGSIHYPQGGQRRRSQDTVRWHCHAKREGENIQYELYSWYTLTQCSGKVLNFQPDEKYRWHVEVIPL